MITRVQGRGFGRPAPSSSFKLNYKHERRGILLKRSLLDSTNVNQSLNTDFVYLERSNSFKTPSDHLLPRPLPHSAYKHSQRLKMARYLTPASIGLLCLIELYRDQVVQVQSTVPILSFIVSHLLPSSLPKPQNNIPGAPARETSLNIIITPDDFQKVLQGHRAFNQVSGKTLWDAFLEELWGIDSLDALHEFFESRRELLQKTKEQVKKDREDGVAPADPRKIYISRTSPMGAFVRRAQLEFTRLKFHDAVNLWKAFVNYRQTTFDYYKIRHPEAGTWKFDKVLEGEKKKDGEKEEWANGTRATFLEIGYENFGKRDIAGMVSTNDIEKLLEFQIDQMQSKLL